MNCNSYSCGILQNQRFALFLLSTSGLEWNALLFQTLSKNNNLKISLKIYLLSHFSQLNSWNFCLTFVHSSVIVICSFRPPLRPSASSPNYDMLIWGLSSTKFLHNLLKIIFKLHNYRLKKIYIIQSNSVQLPFGFLVILYQIQKTVILFDTCSDCSFIIFVSCCFPKGSDRDWDSMRWGVGKLYLMICCHQQKDCALRA